MRHKLFHSALILLVSYTISFGQAKTEDNTHKMAKLSVPMDSCFVQTLTYLQNHNYFIEAVDRASGFIRAKNYTKNNKVLSSQAGEKRTLTVLLRPSGNETVLSLNMYSETLKRGGNTSTLVYYYEDKGIVNEPAIYQNLIADLTKEIQ